MRIKEIEYTVSACIEGVFSPVQKKVTVEFEPNEWNINPEYEKQLINEMIETTSFGATLMKEKMNVNDPYNNAEQQINYQQTNKNQNQIPNNTYGNQSNYSNNNIEQLLSKCKKQHRYPKNRIIPLELSLFWIYLCCFYKNLSIIF